MSEHMGANIDYEMVNLNSYSVLVVRSCIEASKIETGSTAVCSFGSYNLPRDHFQSISRMTVVECPSFPSSTCVH